MAEHLRCNGVHVAGLQECEHLGSDDFLQRHAAGLEWKFSLNRKACVVWTQRAAKRFEHAWIATSCVGVLLGKMAFVSVYPPNSWNLSVDEFKRDFDDVIGVLHAAKNFGAQEFVVSMDAQVELDSDASTITGSCVRGFWHPDPHVHEHESQLQRREILMSVAQRFKLKFSNSFGERRVPTRKDPRWPNTESRWKVLDYVAVPQIWKTQAFIKPHRFVSDHFMVVTMVWNQATCCMFPSSWRGHSLKGWTPKNWRSLRQFRVACEKGMRDAQTDGRVRKEELPKTSALSMTTDVLCAEAQAIDFQTTALRKSQRPTKPPELWIAERKIRRTWGSHKTLAKRERNRLRRKFRAELARHDARGSSKMKAPLVR